MATPPRSSDISKRGPYPWWISLPPLIVGLPVRAIFATLRVRSVVGREHLESLVTGKQPAIFAFWHNREFICAEFLRRTMRPLDLPLTVMASHSNDGEMAARFATRLGYNVIRGSASLGGTGALHSLYRAVSRRRESVLFTPDGPRGPQYDCKPGVLALSKLSGAPIIPVGGAADRSWRLRSWDRLLLPRPFAGLSLAIGRPITIPKALGRKEQIDAAVDLGNRITELDRIAETAIARGNPAGAAGEPGGMPGS